MFTVTDAAAEFLSAKLAEVQAPEEMAARFVVENQGLTIRIDSESPGDTTFSHGDRTVALLDQEVVIQLAGMTLDLQETPEGQKLTLVPNVPPDSNGEPA